MELRVSAGHGSDVGLDTLGETLEVALEVALEVTVEPKAREIETCRAPRQATPSPRAGRFARMLAALALTSLGAGLAACSSSGTSAPEPAQGPVELRYFALAKNLTFGIVNATSTDRIDLYSKAKPLDQATTKVSPDEVVDAVVQYFREQGFFEIAQPRGAPRPAPAGATQMIEVSLPDGKYHAILRSGVSLEFATRFQTCAKALLDVYNNTLQLQSVDEAPEWSGSNPSSRSAKKAGG
jgi:hypothetical protein